MNYPVKKSCLVTTTQTHLFLQEVFHKLLLKKLISHMAREKERSQTHLDHYVWLGLFLKIFSLLGFCLPSVFDKIVKSKWEAPARTKTNHLVISHFCSLVPEAAEYFKLSVVDAAVAILCSYTLQRNQIGLHRDPCSRKIDQSLHKSCEVSLVV